MQIHICMCACISTQLRDSNEDYLCGISIRRNARSWDHSGSFSGSRYIHTHICIYIYTWHVCPHSKFLWKIFVWNSERNFLLFSYRSSFFIVERLRRRIEVERRGRKLGKKLKKSTQVIGKSKSRRFSRASIRIIFFFFFFFLWTRKKNLDDEVSVGKKKKEKEKGRKTAIFRENRELWNGSSGCN